MNLFERGHFLDSENRNRDDEVFEGRQNPRVLSESDVSHILTGDPVVVFQILDTSGEPVRVGDNFLVYVIWHRSFGQRAPPIEIVHVPANLWAAFAAADGGWHHHESIHTNNLVHASVRIPAVKRLISVRRGLVRCIPEHTVRARTIMGMRLRRVYPNDIGLIEGHLADERWQRHTFCFRVRLGKVERKHSFQIFSDALIQTIRDCTNFGDDADKIDVVSE